MNTHYFAMALILAILMATNANAVDNFAVSADLETAGNLETVVNFKTAAARQILITIVDDGVAAFERDYHRPGYALPWPTRQTLTGIARDYGFKQINGWPIEILHVYCAVMELPDGADIAAHLAQLQRDSRIKLAQRMQIFRAHGSYNDPYFALQYGDHAAQIERWHERATGRDVRIAVIDTGVDREHPDLRQRLQLTRNFVDDDRRFDSDIHGTAVAGIIAATANNAVGIVGIAPNVALLALKACWQPHMQSIAAYCNSFSLAKALSFAIEQRVDIINLSLGGPDDPLLTQLLQAALARKMLIVAAQNQRDDFPADMPGVIAVTETSQNTLVSHASGQHAPTLSANASELLSTSPGGHYDFYSGSSMAAARVSGLSALMRQQQRDLTAQQLLDQLDHWTTPPAAMAHLHY